MSAVYTEHAERGVIRTARVERTCWTWLERDGSPEPQCTRLIAPGEQYLAHTVFPGHDSGYADGGYERRMQWNGTEYVWIKVAVPARPLTSHFCLPCCERWTNLKRAVDHIKAVAS